jgi:hypothetical protein
MADEGQSRQAARFLFEEHRARKPFGPMLETWAPRTIEEPYVMQEAFRSICSPSSISRLRSSSTSSNGPTRYATRCWHGMTQMTRRTYSPARFPTLSITSQSLSASAELCRSRIGCSNNK